MLYQNKIRCNIERTRVLKAEKAAVLLLFPGLVDRSCSRTVPTLLTKSWHSKLKLSKVDPQPDRKLHCKCAN